VATSPMPDPQQSGSSATPPPDAGGAASSPQGGGGSQQPSPSSAPANPLQMLLARWYQTAKQMASSDPRLASGAGKVADGIQEMQTALVSPSQPSSPSQQPPQ
jgi:X-X-X-Leu-X-X-Gly heptad repeat protein